MIYESSVANSSIGATTHVTPDLNSPNAIYQQRTPNLPNLPFMSQVLAMNTTPHAKKGITNKINLRTQMLASEDNTSVGSNATPKKGISISSKTSNEHAIRRRIS